LDVTKIPNSIGTIIAIKVADR